MEIRSTKYWFEIPHSFNRRLKTMGSKGRKEINRKDFAKERVNEHKI